MSILKEFRYPVSAEWHGGPSVRMRAPGKPDLEIVTPPEFRGGVAGVWSPEDLLVGAAVSCYALTIGAVAEHLGVKLLGLDVRGAGHLVKRENGRFGFVAIELTVDMTMEAEHVGAAENLAAKAREICIVTLALDVPIHVDVAVHAPAELVA
jgi:organic hydroperoxide reductase OsmC/OhrA